MKNSKVTAKIKCMYVQTTSFTNISYPVYVCNISEIHKYFSRLFIINLNIIKCYLIIIIQSINIYIDKTNNVIKCV